MRLRIAYLINQYPKVSHSFIRREILALEADSIPVLRYSIRQCSDELTDAGDIAERGKTRAILSAGFRNLITASVKCAILHPVKFLRTTAKAFSVGVKSDRGLLRNMVYVAEACVLLEWTRNDKIDHIHCHFGTNAPAVAMFCSMLGGPPYSFTVHGPEEFDKPLSLAFDAKIAGASHVIAVSQFGRSQIQRWCDRPHWQKIHVIHCGLDEAFLDAQTTPVPSTAQLVCIGRLSEQKGHVTLLAAARRLVSDGHDLQLLLVGDGPLRPDIESMIAEYDLSRSVSITGWASGEEVRRHLLNSRAFVLPSFAEGLPVVLMEAMALGRPVISTWVAGIPELVTHGVNGWLVPPGDVDALAAAMKEALEAPVQQLEEMGRNGAGKVRENHDARKEAVKLAGLFRQSIETWGQAPFSKATLAR